MDEAEKVMCERCGEAEADVLIEHITYGEAVCKGCRDDEEMFYIAQNQREFQPEA